MLKPLSDHESVNKYLIYYSSMGNRTMVINNVEDVVYAETESKARLKFIKQTKGRFNIVRVEKLED